MTLEFSQEDGINAELGLAASEDAVIDSLSEKAEKEIVFGNSGGKNLIGHCAPFLSRLCRNFSLMHKVNVSLIPFIYMFRSNFLFINLVEVDHRFTILCGNGYLFLLVVMFF